MEWRQVKDDNTDSAEQIANQCLWYNKCIKLGGQTIYNSKLFSLGLWTVKDLYNQGIITNVNVWAQRGATWTDILILQGIVASVPEGWKLLLKENGDIKGSLKTGILIPNATFISIDNMTQKDVKQLYTVRNFKKLKQSDFKAKAYFETKFGVLSDENWKTIYLLPWKLHCDNKTKDIHYKILNKIIPTNYLLYKMEKICSPLCGFCEYNVETIDHLFFMCNTVRNLWLQVFESWNYFSNINVVPTCKECVLGIYDTDITNVNDLNMLTIRLSSTIETLKES